MFKLLDLFHTWKLVLFQGNSSQFLGPVEPHCQVVVYVHGKVTFKLNKIFSSQICKIRNLENKLSNKLLLLFY